VVAQTLIDAMCAGLSTPCIGKTGCTRLAVALKQATTMPVGNTETLSSKVGCQPPVDNVLNNFDAVNLFQRKYP